MRHDNDEPMLVLDRLFHDLYDIALSFRAHFLCILERSESELKVV